MVNLAEMDRIIRNATKIKESIEKAENRSTRMTRIIDNMPHSKEIRSLVEEGAVTAVDLKSAYVETYNIVQAMRNELSEMIDTLPNQEERSVMRLRYIHGYKPEFIADGIFVSERQIFRYIRSAKQHLAEKFPDRFIIGDDADDQRRQS